MADVAALAAKVPQAWQRNLVPFIQRSAEFEQVKQPLVGYFLLQYVAHVGMKLHKAHTNKAESTPFVMALLDVLESKKTSLASELANADGRTELSRSALALFTRADDDERAGIVSEAIVKLFYSSSLLFEATKQFMDDDQMDPFAAEKHRYAQVVAARMKKALATGTPYESPNGAKERIPTDDNELTGSTSSATIHSPPTAPPSAPSVPSNTNYGYTPPADTTPPPAPANYGYTPPAATTQPSKPAPPPTVPPTTSITTPVTPPAPSQYHPPAPPQPTQSSPASYTPTSTYQPPSAPTGSYNPTPNDMIDAQKYAKLAVSALQFYDHVNARKQLIAALEYLDGQKK